MISLPDNTWGRILRDEVDKDYFKELVKFLELEYEKEKIYPKKEELFTALSLTDYEDVKVVIFGQDPYHGEGQAYGLAFGVKDGVRVPPSLRNIYKELNEDLGIEIPESGNLTAWAREGILLLNTVLTVREGSPKSHRKKGWETFTDMIIDELNKREDPIIFVLWGNDAKEKEKLITNDIHHIIKSVHPSPLSASRGFFGSKPFSQINEILRSEGKKEIDFSL